MGRTHARARWLACAGALLALCGALLGGCGSGSRDRPEITLYNGQHIETTDALVASFERTTGIRVAVRSDDEDTLADEIVTEGSSSPADVIYTGNSPALEYLRQRGLLAAVDGSTLAQIPSRYDSPQGEWVGVSARVSVLIYNPSLIKASGLPKHVSELADRRYEGKLAIAPGETDFQPVVSSYARTYGSAAAVRWLEGLKANAASHIYPNNETIAAQVNRGAVAFGIINQYYWYRMRAQLGARNVRSKLAYLAPHDPGYVLDVSGAGILASSRHRQAAQRLLAFLVSSRAQEIIAHSISFEYPLRPTVRTAAPQTPFGQLQPDPIAISALGDGSTALELLRKAGLL